MRNMEKRKYEKPMLVSEAFVPQYYAKVCDGWTTVDTAKPVHPSEEFILDDGDKIYEYPGDDTLVSTDNSFQVDLKGQTSNTWGWLYNNGNPDKNTMYLLFPKKGGSGHYYAFDRSQVKNNHS